MNPYLKTIRLTIRVSVFFFCLCLSFPAFSQLAFDHLSVSNGLSQSTVLSICKDSRGYMWFGTRDCLNRYDGKGVKIYKSDPENPASISAEDYIYALTEDRKHNLWVGTQNGLNRYIPEKDAFERIAFNTADPNRISDKIVLSIFADSKGRVWFGTNHGLSMLDNPSSRKFHKFYQQDGLAGNTIYAVFEDREGNIWVGTTEGLSMMRVKDGHFQIRTFRHNPADPSSISENSVKTIAQDHKGRIWIGAETQGLNMFVPETGTFKHFRSSVLRSNGLSNDNIRKIMTDKNGNLWIATMNGLNVLDPETLEFKIYKHDADNRKSLSDNSIKDIYEDERGSIWVGSMFGGVNVTHRNTISFTVYKYNKFGNSISSDIISVIQADNKDNLWIGTEGQGLNYLDIKTGLFKKFIHDPRDPGSLSGNTIKAIFRDKKDRIWIGLYQGGLELFIPATGKFKHYPPTAGGLNSGTISSITEDDHGRLLVGTAAKGLNIFDPEKGSFQFITDAPGSALRLNSNYIRFANQDTKKNLWVGTPAGLSMLPAGAKTFTYFFKNSRSRDSLQSNRINCMLEDHKGQIWIGSMGGGLSRYQPKTRSFVTYDKGNGLASENIIDLLEDNEGNLWMSTDRGLTRFNLKQESFKNYSTDDGLPTNEFNVNSAYKDNNGKLYFGSYNGLVVFTPRVPRENTVVPQLAFSGLKLFNKPVLIGGSDQLLKEDISFTRSINFSADQNIFTIDFLALNYIQPHRNKYAYKLDGFEKDWNYVSIPSATYTNLPAGTYKLLIKGSNNDGLWSSIPASMEIRVRPPLWQTWWAYMLYVITAGIVLYYILRFTKRQQLLKAELYYEHLNHQQEQENYRMKLDFFTRISHEIRTPLTLISAPLDKLIRLTQDHQSVNEPLQGIKRNTDRLLRLIGELLNLRKIESGHARLLVSENDLVAFCRNIYNAYLGMAETNAIDYRFHTAEDEILVFFDAGQMEKVCYNMLSNAFKYTPERGQITFSVSQEQGQAVLKISDTGIGIPADLQEKIFINFYQVKSGSLSAQGWGIGLALVKNIIDLHHGTIAVSSVPATAEKNGHTTFTVSLLLGSTHFAAEDIVVQDAAGNVLPLAETVPAVPGFVVPVVDEIEKKYTILVVEDNEELRGFLIQSLQNNYNILEASDGLAGLEMASTHIPDLIISDVMMPGLDGLEFCARLKMQELTSHIPVIMLTAMATQQNQVHGLEAGADVYMSKPFSIQVLELSIANLLSRREELKKNHLRQIMLQPKKIAMENPEEKFLRKLMEFIEQHMQEPEFNVSSLVDQMSMSQTALYKKIKVLTGLSIADFIKVQRLKRAAQLLSDHKLSIADVAYAVGFNDRKYFSREFRKQFGYAPSEYPGA